MKVVGIIPARYGSTRLPGKPLRMLLGYPMVWWVYQRACSVKGLSEVYVATDDERIQNVCRDAGIPVVMTADTHQTAAHRLQEVSQSIAADFYLQLNGDEPMINTQAIAAAILQDIPQDREFGVNIITKMKSPAQVMDSSNIKMVFDQQMNALYMSRTPIPYPFRALDFVYYKHVGIIGYNKAMLDFYSDTSPGRLEQIEGIDTLRFLDYGKQLKLVLVEDCESLSVDTEKDFLIVEAMMKKGEKNNV